jgi:hypothetical protein
VPISSENALIAYNDKRSVISKQLSPLTVAMRKPLPLVARF